MAMARKRSSRTGTRSPAPSANTPWSDDELRRSVDVYVLLLRLQIQGMDERSEPIAQALLRGPLALRNSAAIRYRMRNISAVVRELGASTLIDFSPAESVGSGVRPRIREMLQENGDFVRLLGSNRRSLEQRRQDALTTLAALRERIAEVEGELSWVGHNNPPESIDAEGLDREQFRQALADVDNLAKQVQAERPDLPAAEQSRKRLVRFAVAIGKWVGARTTNFTDAALKTAAPVLVVKVTGLMPAIVEALELVARALSH
jgi:hypothetical protein